MDMIFETNMPKYILAHPTFKKVCEYKRIGWNLPSMHTINYKDYETQNELKKYLMVK